MARRRNFFEKFRETAARTAAVAAVRLAERNYQRRRRYWERKHPGEAAEDIRAGSGIIDMNTNQLKAYARRLGRMRGKAIEGAGIYSPIGEILSKPDFLDYSEMWTKREDEKAEWRQKLKLKGVNYDEHPMALVDIDPKTGKPKPGRGSNFLLRGLGEVQVPATQQTLERRKQQMKGWLSIEERLDISEDNMLERLEVIDSQLAAKWNLLTRAQKQYLINFESLFDKTKQLTISTDRDEVQRYANTRYEEYASKLADLYSLIEKASKMEAA